MEPNRKLDPRSIDEQEQGLKDILSELVRTYQSMPPFLKDSDMYREYVPKLADMVHEFKSSLNTDQARRARIDRADQLLVEIIRKPKEQLAKLLKDGTPMFKNQPGRNT